MASFRQMRFPQAVVLRFQINNLSIVHGRLFKITVNVQNVISFDTCGISKTISRVEYVRNGRPPSEADIDAEPVEAYP